MVGILLHCTEKLRNIFWLRVLCLELGLCRLDPEFSHTRQTLYAEPCPQSPRSSVSKGLHSGMGRIPVALVSYGRSPQVLKQPCVVAEVWRPTEVDPFHFSLVREFRPVLAPSRLYDRIFDLWCGWLQDVLTEPKDGSPMAVVT